MDRMRKQPRSQLHQLEDVCRGAKRLFFEFTLDLPDRIVIANVDGRNFGAALTSGANEIVPRVSGRTVRLRQGRLSDSLSDLKRQYPKARLQTGALKVISKQSPIKGAALERLIAAALGEVFGSADEERSLKDAKVVAARDRAEYIALLCAGAKGVESWNNLPIERREQRGPYRHVDLAGAKLNRVMLRGLTFDHSILRNAVMKDSNIGSASFKHADLANVNLARSLCLLTIFRFANLFRANLTGSDCTEADFRNAILRSASLDKCDLIGADFSGADLTNATMAKAKFGTYPDGTMGIRYNSKTIFPKGFKPGKGWRKVGK